MKRRSRGIFAGAAACWLLLALPGCASMPLPPVDRYVQAAAAADGMPIERVARGYQLMRTHCIACHVAIHPTELSMAEWDDAMPRMLRKSHLLEADGEDLRAYVVAVRRAATQQQQP